MPLRSTEILQAWLAEFVELGYPEVRALKALRQDVDDDSEAGLVRVTFANATTVTYIEPAGPRSPQWVVTLEPREEPLLLGASEMQKLSEELATVAALSRFLETKSIEFLATH